MPVRISHYSNWLRCNAEFSPKIRSTYPSLTTWLLTRKRHECPTQVTLGTRGHFFIRTVDYSVRSNLPTYIPDRAKVWRVWLGYGRAYVVQYDSGKFSRDLDGHYQPLNNLLKNYDRIKVLIKYVATPTLSLISLCLGSSPGHSRP